MGSSVDLLISRTIEVPGCISGSLPERRGDDADDKSHGPFTWKGWRDRVAADPDFPFKVLIEQVHLHVHKASITVTALTSCASRQRDGTISCHRSSSRCRVRCASCAGDWRGGSGAGRHVVEERLGHSRTRLCVLYSRGGCYLLQLAVAVACTCAWLLVAQHPVGGLL